MSDQTSSLHQIILEKPARPVTMATTPLRGLRHSWIVTTAEMRGGTLRIPRFWGTGESGQSTMRTTPAAPPTNSPRSPLGCTSLKTNHPMASPMVNHSQPIGKISACPSVRTTCTLIFPIPMSILGMPCLTGTMTRSAPPLTAHHSRQQYALSMWRN